MSAEQLGLRYSGLSVLDEDWAELLDRIREVVSFRGLKQVAYDLNERPADLSNALAERDRHHLILRHLPYFVRHAPTHDIVRLVASWRGLVVEEPPPPTPEEELRALKDALETSLGPELRAAILAQAKKNRR